MKPDFKSLAIEDKEDVLRILQKRKSNSFSQTFASYFLWAEEHKTKACINDDILYIKYDLDLPKYEMPRGAASDGELKSALGFIFQDAKISGNGQGFQFTRLLVDEAEKLEELFPEKFEIDPVRDDFEYIYSASDLADLKGKKYHSKRNHIAKFTKNHDWEYTPLDIRQKDVYFDFFEEWFKSRSNSNPNELVAISKALQFYDELAMQGAAIVVDGRIVACTIGEKINSDTFLVHFEKALPEFAEAYAVINNRFCKSIVEDGYKFVNREEDLGIEGLRKAKLSYCPCTLLEKYDATLKKQ